MGQIFISYANEDSDAARRLAEAFVERGWSVWWDKQIPPGMDYAKVIEEAVTAAQCVVVLWSKHSIRSRWVQTEAAEGADRHIVATVIVDETPGEDVPFEFRRLQAVNLNDWQPGRTHAGFDLLVARIASMLGAPAGDPGRSTDSPDPRPDPRPDPPPAMAGWGEALTSWGRGRQTVFRAIGAVSALLAFAAGLLMAENAGTPGLVGVAALTLFAVSMIHLGRRPA